MLQNGLIKKINRNKRLVCVMSLLEATTSLFVIRVHEQDFHAIRHFYTRVCSIKLLALSFIQKETTTNFRGHTKRHDIIY